MTRFRDYDPFARIYNLHWGSFANEVYPILERLVLRHLPRRSAVLDLCCGTGQLAARLAADGHAVTGVDGSEAMIGIARSNAPAARFVVQDAREPLPAGDFQAAFSTYDSLNHLMTLEDLTRVFGNVREVLAPGGRFAFDLNMAAAYEERWQGTFAQVEDEHVCLVRSSRDAARRMGYMRVTIFEQGRGGWKRSDVGLTQRWYAEDDVVAALGRAGFADVRALGADEPIAAGCPAFPGRTFFVARA